jgi:hypothetical protein
VLDAVDTLNPHARALVTADLLKKLGLNVQIAASDWGNLVIRRASKKPVAEGGWNIFGTGWVGADMLDPSLNQALRTNGQSAWFGSFGRQAGGAAGAMTQNERQRSAPGDRRGDPAARLRDRTLYPDRSVENQDSLPQEPQDLLLGPVIFQWNVEKT